MADELVERNGRIYRIGPGGVLVDVEERAWQMRQARIHDDALRRVNIDRGKRNLMPLRDLPDPNLPDRRWTNF